MTSWTNRDEAWTDVAKGIRSAVLAMTEKPVKSYSSVVQRGGAGEREPSIRDLVGSSDGPGEEVRHGVRQKIERRLKQLKSNVLKNVAEELLGKDESAPEDSNPPLPTLLTTPMELRKFRHDEMAFVELSTTDSVIQIGNRPKSWPRS